jgi:hypothetical protein
VEAAHLDPPIYQPDRRSSDQQCCWSTTKR